MDAPESLHMALPIGIDFCVGAHVQLSELMGIFAEEGV